MTPGTAEPGQRAKALSRKERLPATEISVSGLPNGIFLPRLIAFAAAREGIMVTGYRKDGGGIPAG